MAGDNLNVWYDREGDHLEIVFDQKAGYFEDTPIENVMRKRDVEGNLLAISIFNLSSFAQPQSSPCYDQWAVFNLDIEDGVTFDFDVALGYERLEEGRRIAGVDESARCSVYFHGERSSARLVERTLEIFHAPLTSPIVSLGADPLASVSLVSRCHDQLTLALRLFRPQSFVMFPRERRQEARRRAHLALEAHRAEVAAPYVLRENDVTRFYDFATKLRRFHVERNLYWSIRREPGWFVGMPPDDPDGTRFLKRAARLMIATDLFEQANELHAFSGEMRLLWLVMAAEALFSDEDKSEISNRLATRMACLNGASEEEVTRHRELVLAIYDARSTLMHGAAYAPKLSKRLRTVVEGARFIEPRAEPLLRFNDLVRMSILYFIALHGDERDDILGILDRSGSQPSETARLRKRAQEFWAVTEQDDETLWQA
jgi:hypothetical protein